MTVCLLDTVCSLHSIELYCACCELHSAYRQGVRCVSFDLRQNTLFGQAYSKRSVRSVRSRSDGSDVVMKQTSCLPCFARGTRLSLPLSLSFPVSQSLARPSGLTRVFPCLCVWVFLFCFLEACKTYRFGYFEKSLVKDFYVKMNNCKPKSLISFRHRNTNVSSIPYFSYKDKEEKIRGFCFLSGQR